MSETSPLTPRVTVPRIRLVIALLLYLCVPLWMAWYIYDFTSDGMAATIGEAVGTLLIPGLIALAVARRKYIFPYYIAVALSALALLSGNLNRIDEARDAHRFTQEMAAATAENYRELLAHSKSQIGQTINASLEITDRYGKTFQSLVASLDDERLANMLTSETLLSHEKRVLLRNELLKKLQLATTALPQIDELYSKMKNDLVTTISPSKLKDSFIIGFDETSSTNKKLLQEYVSTYYDAYKHLVAMCDILDENDGKFQIGQDGKVIFATNPPIAPYNQETAGLQQDMTNIVRLQNRLAEAQQAGITKIVNAAK